MTEQHAIDELIAELEQTAQRLRSGDLAQGGEAGRFQPAGRRCREGAGRSSAGVSSSRGAKGIEFLRGSFEVAASAWERSVLPLRVAQYEPTLLDMLCLAGEVGWARVSAR